MNNSGWFFLVVERQQGYADRDVAVIDRQRRLNRLLELPNKVMVTADEQREMAHLEWRFK
jgi:hypothetical protein